MPPGGLELMDSPMDKIHNDLCDPKVSRSYVK